MVSLFLRLLRASIRGRDIAPSFQLFEAKENALGLAVAGTNLSGRIMERNGWLRRWF
jgi:hypothetical protein